MREILFRGRDKYTNEWFYGFVEAPHTTVDGVVESYYFNSYVNGKSCRKIISADTLGQYTGLTDKNGKKIFEGDIVKREYTLWHGETKKTRETQIGVVSYSNKDCGFCLDKVCNLRKPWDGDTLEIIGNIHDNKLEDF